MPECLLDAVAIENMVDQISLCHDFKVKSGMAPDYLGEHFNPVHTGEPSH